LGGSATGGWYGWDCGVESIQTPPSSSYFSGDKFNIALSWLGTKEGGGEEMKIFPFQLKLRWRQCIKKLKFKV